MKEIVGLDGRRMRRVSRWIKVRTNYNPNYKNYLWTYACDDWGYRPTHEMFFPDNGVHLDYFRYKGRNYAVGQFCLLNSPFVGQQIFRFIEDGEEHYVSTVDMDGNMFNPLFAEWDEYGEHVRLYEAV